MTEMELIREQEKAEGLRMATKAGKLLLSLTLVLMLALGLTLPAGAASVIKVQNDSQRVFVSPDHIKVQNDSQRVFVSPDHIKVQNDSFCDCFFVNP